VETGIGATLREARVRRKIDLPKVEADIKIRIRYLQAMENEAWDALPGGAYTRGFVRTYAYYLGLDGERLADEYKRATAVPGGERVPRRVEPVPTPSGHGGPRIPGRAMAVAVSLGLIGLLVGIGLTGGDGDDPSAPAPDAKQSAERPQDGSRSTTVASQPGVAVQLAATAEVWVCLLGGDEEPLVDGEILTAGAEAGPFRDDRFTLALGNGEVELSIDGREADTPPSSSPVGYTIDSRGELSALEEGERPDCE
jgi:cytoskeleton protein RodZ